MNERDLVLVLKALADPTRFAMVQKIAAAGELTCSEVTSASDLSQPTVSHHLKILTEAGVLTVRNEGKRHHLSVNHAVLGAAFDLAPALLGPRGAKKAERASRKST